MQNLLRRVESQEEMIYELQGEAFSPLQISSACEGLWNSSSPQACHYLEFTEGALKWLALHDKIGPNQFAAQKITAMHALLGVSSGLTFLHPYSFGRGVSFGANLQDGLGGRQDFMRPISEKEGLEIPIGEVVARFSRRIIDLADFGPFEGVEISPDVYSLGLPQATYLAALESTLDKFKFSSLPTL